MDKNWSPEDILDEPLTHSVQPGFLYGCAVGTLGENGGVDAKTNGRRARSSERHTPAIAGTHVDGAIVELADKLELTTQTAAVNVDAPAKIAQQRLIFELVTDDAISVFDVFNGGTQKFE